VEEIDRGKSFSMLLMCEDKQVGSMKELLNVEFDSDLSRFKAGKWC
jgi:hypothetical protein